MKTARKLSLARPTALSRAASKIKEGEKRIVADVPERIWRQLKVKIAQEGVSVRDYVLGMLKERGIK